MNRPAGRPEQSGRPARLFDGGGLTRLGLAYRAWRYRWRVDPDGIRWMRGVLRSGDVAIDAGAYKGGYTYWMRRAVGDEGRVLAFEPQAETASYLRSCVDAFQWSNVSVEEVALSSEVGRRELLRPDRGASPAASLVGASLPPDPLASPVPTDTLDRHLAARDLLGARVRFIKCDVEGHELDVLRGAERTVREHRPTLLLECEPRHLRDATIADVFGYLVALGYRGSFIWHGRVLDAWLFDPRVHQVPGRKPYANNFMFVPIAPTAPTDSTPDP